jgi:RNA polymerase sigma factor (TIGR02999 family)
MSDQDARTTSEIPARGEITALLNSVASGDLDAEAELMQQLYEKLCRMASHEVASWGTPAPSEPNDVAHEAFLKVLRAGRTAWPSRRYFYGALARAMHNYLIDLKRTAGREAAGTGEAVAHEAPGEDPIDLILLCDCLEELEQVDSRAAEVLRSFYFLGLTIQEIARVFELGHATVERDLAFARTWLHRRMNSV